MTGAPSLSNALVALVLGEATLETILSWLEPEPDPELEPELPFNETIFLVTGADVEAAADADARAGDGTVSAATLEVADDFTEAETLLVEASGTGNVRD